jgi:hypothetical protein
MRKLDKTIETYNILIKKYEYKLDEEKFESHCDSYEKTKTKIEELDTIMNGTFGHIPNYKKLIQTQDMELFSNYRIGFIISEYEKIIKFLEDSCNEVQDIDYIDSVELNTNDNST